MKKMIRKAFSGLLVSAFLFIGTPLASAQGQTLRNAEQRCERVTGREQARCKFVNGRNSRLRYRRANASASVRGHTLREQRHVFRNRPASDIRRIGSFDLQRLKRHDGSRGRARRLISTRRDNARSACKGIIDSTERALCIRDKWRQRSRGNTK